MYQKEKEGEEWEKGEKLKIFLLIFIVVAIAVYCFHGFTEEIINISAHYPSNPLIILK